MIYDRLKLICCLRGTISKEKERTVREKRGSTASPGKNFSATKWQNNVLNG